MRKADIIGSILIIGLGLLNVLLIAGTWLAYTHLFESITMGAVVGYGILSVILTIVDIFVIVFTIMMAFAWADL